MEAYLGLSTSETLDPSEGTLNYVAVLPAPFTASGGQKHWIAIRTELIFAPRWGIGVTERGQVT